MSKKPKAEKTLDQLITELEYLTQKALKDFRNKHREELDKITVGTCINTMRWLCSLAKYEEVLICCDEVALLDSGELDKKQILKFKAIALKELERFEEAINLY